MKALVHIKDVLSQGFWHKRNLIIISLTFFFNQRIINTTRFRVFVRLEENIKYFQQYSKLISHYPPSQGRHP